MAILGAIGLDLDTTVLNLFDAGSAGTITAGAGRNGGAGLSQSNQQAFKVLAATQATLNIACGLNFTPNSNTLGNIVGPAFYDAGTVQVNLRIALDGTIAVYRGNTTLLGSSAIGAYTNGIYNHIEVSATIHPTAGAVQVWVNGASVINLTSVNTRNTANSFVTQMAVTGPAFASSCITCDIVYGTTRINDCRVECRMPTGTGTNAAFTPSTAVANWTTVDETPPNTTDYNETATVNAIDSFAHAALAGSPTSISAVIVNVRAQNTTTGAGSIAPFLRSSTTDSPGTAVALNTSYQDIQSVYETDPATGSAWANAAAVNAAEIGYKKTV